MYELSRGAAPQVVDVGVEVQAKEAAKRLAVGVHGVWKEGGNGHGEQNGSEAGVHLSIHSELFGQRTEG